jgi:hypothetical protein
MEACPHCGAPLGVLNHEAAEAHVSACERILLGAARVVGSADAPLPELPAADRPPAPRGRRS